MTPAGNDTTAQHLEGGNLFDDLRIDIAASHRRLDDLRRTPRSIRRSRSVNGAKLFLTRLANRLRIYELLVVNGIRRKWLDEFSSYWSQILGGRPFVNSIDFFLLLHDYRKRQQHTAPLEWSDAHQHLANWQHPSQLYSTLHNVRKLASQPLVSRALWQEVPRGARILEYGCSLAPYYNCYREFFTHQGCHWTLADIPNFPFHYARYRYRDDAEVELLTINAADFGDPLGDRGGFDVIILTTVLEHLDHPLFVTDYLLDRLKPGGLLVFDYIKSEGLGLDHPAGLEMRKACLQRILARTDVLHGDVEDIEQSVNLCIARKKLA